MNFGFMMAVTTHRTSNSTEIPISFFMASVCEGGSGGGKCADRQPVA